MAWIQFTVFVLVLIKLSHTADNLNFEPITMKTQLGSLKGRKVQNKQTSQTVFEFRGIPFGKPPVGKLRFQKPEAAGGWADTLDATEFGAACPQSTFTPDFTPAKMSEDCLFLNVYVPKKIDPNAKLSVMVWIHGGGLTYGSSNQYGGGWIATESDVIVVTINYRLDIFGFLAVNHPASRGNYGLWDQKLALQWVHDNIAAFGGNPESVTIFGQSAGGWSCSFQSLIPSNKGLFQRLISQSGVADKMNILSKKRVNEIVADLATKTECPLYDMTRFVDCLRKLDVDVLLNATKYYQSLPKDELVILSNYLPVVDGDLYPTHPLVELENPESDVSNFFKSIDFITGNTDVEGNSISMLARSIQDYYDFNSTIGIPLKALCNGYFGPLVRSFFENEPEVKQKLCDFYTSAGDMDNQSMRAADALSDVVFGYPAFKMLQYHAVGGAKTYQYQFSRVTDIEYLGPKAKWLKGAGHGEEMVFLFDLGVLLPSLDGHEFPDEEKKLSKFMIKYWTSFAKTGEPDGGEGSLPWKEYDRTERNYINFDVPISQGTNLNAPMTEFWSKQIPDIKVGPDSRYDESHPTMIGFTIRIQPCVYLLAVSCLVVSCILYKIQL